MTDRISKTETYDAQQDQTAANCKQHAWTERDLRVTLTVLQFFLADLTNHISTSDSRKFPLFGILGSLTRGIPDRIRESRHCPRRSPRLVQQRKQFYRQWKHNRCVLFHANLRQRLQVAQLQRNGLRRKQRRSIHKLLRRVELAFCVNNL